jgi:lysophospholipase L1-like esterase
MTTSFRTPSKRTFVLLGVAIATFIGVVAYIQFHLMRPIGAGPAGPQVDRTPFETVWTDRPVRLIGIGDSITAGLGARSKDHTFFNRLIRNPSDEYSDMAGRCLSQVLPQLTHENFAVSGSTSQAHLEVIENRLTPSEDDVFGIVVMTTGGNDLIHNYGRSPPRECAMYGATLAQAEPWIQAYEVRLSSMLDKIQANFPGGCEIYLGDIYDPTDGVGDAPSVYLPTWPDGLAIHARYNEAIAKCVAGRSNVHIVPLHKTFLGHGAHCTQFWRSTYVTNDPYYWFYENIEDPNDRGYDAIRRVFLNKIVEKTSLRQALNAPHK